MAIIRERKSKEGTVSYSVRVRLKGHPEQSKTFQRKTDAREWAIVTEAALRERRAFPTREAKKHTVKVAIDRYLSDYLPTKQRNKTSAQIKNVLLWWRREIGRCTLADLSPQLLIECRDKLKRTAGVAHKTQRSSGTVNRFLAHLSDVLQVAVKEWQWLTVNPMRSVSKLAEPKGRERFLSDEERQALLIACKQSAQPFLYVIVVLALSTGMRRGEIAKLQWVDVDVSGKTIKLSDTKNGERRLVPLVGHAADVLRDLRKVRRIGSKLLFPGANPEKPVDFEDAWQGALKKAKVKNFRFHDLRHSAASYMAMNGATHIELAAVLGHKTLAMVKRYSHLTDSHLAGVVESMNSKIFG